MNFSTNQVRHFYVLKNKQTTAAGCTTVGDFCPELVINDGNKAIHIAYRGYGGLTHTDLIPVANIRKVTRSPYHKLREALPAVKVGWTSSEITVGNEYLLNFRFPQFISLAIEEDFTKSVNFIYTTGSTFGTQLKAAIDTVFSNDPYNLITVTVDETHSNDLHIIITSNEQPWKRGIMESRTNKALVYGLKEYTPARVQTSWGTVTDATNVATGYIKNGKRIADLEYFCMGERADLYRNVGWPNVVETEYVITPTEARVSEYDVIDIHYFYQGEGLNNDYSEKVITFVGLGLEEENYTTGDPLFDLEKWLSDNSIIPTVITSNFSPAFLPKPTALTVPSATITATQAVIDWTEGGTETDWELDYKKDTDTTWTTVEVTTSSTKTVTGLTAGTKYNCRVRATDGDGKYSKYTAEVSFTTAAS